MLQSRKRRIEVPTPGSRYRIRPKYCYLKIAGNTVLSLLFLLSACFLFTRHGGSEVFKRLLVAMYGVKQLWQVHYWFDTLRRIRRGEVAELVYPRDFQSRSKAETVFARIGVIFAAVCVFSFSIWGLRTATHQGFALDLFLTGLNAAAWWGVYHVFTRGDTILKSPVVRFQTASTISVPVDAQITEEKMPALLSTQAEKSSSTGHWWTDTQVREDAKVTARRG